MAPSHFDDEFDAALSWRSRTSSKLSAVIDVNKHAHEEHDLKMRNPQSDTEEKDCPPPEELECKICYQRYNVHNRKPKILDCLHRVCARCLIKILDIADSAGCICCPFCRHQTEMTEYEVSALPDDLNIISYLAMRDKSWSSDQNKEVVLTPKSFSASTPSHDSSNCLVITIMEVQRESQQTQSGSSDAYAEQSLDSVSIGSNEPADQDALSKLCNHVPRILVWLLGFLYFGSLPLGIYLLVIQRVTLGIVCVSLVPSSLTVCLVYGFCQCLCQGMCDCSSRN